MAEALRFIDRAKQGGKPFFVVIWFGSPHEPYSALEKDLALYANLPASFANRKVRLTSNETGRPVERLQRDVLRGGLRVPPDRTNDLRGGAPAHGRHPSGSRHDLHLPPREQGAVQREFRQGGWNWPRS